MKKLAAIFCLFCRLNNSFGQDTAYNKVDIAKFGSWKEFNAAHHNPLYVVDGKPIDDTLAVVVLKNLDIQSILEINILKDISSKQVYIERTRREVILIVTMSIAREEYQKKLGKFSEDYRKYIEAQKQYNQNEDGILLTVINDMPVLSHGRKYIKTLYDIPEEKIASVVLQRQQTCCGTNVSLIIATK